MALPVTQYVDHHVLGDVVGILCGLYYFLLVLYGTYPPGRQAMELEQRSPSKAGTRYAQARG